MTVIGVARAVIGVAVLAFIPGYAWTRLFLPTLRSWIEWLAVAVVMSIVLVILAVVVGNLWMGIAITPTHAVWEALAVTLAALVVEPARRLHRVLDRLLRET